MVCVFKWLAPSCAQAVLMEYAGREKILATVRKTACRSVEMVFVSLAGTRLCARKIVRQCRYVEMAFATQMKTRLYVRKIAGGRLPLVNGFWSRSWIPISLLFIDVVPSLTGEGAVSTTLKIGLWG